MITLKEIEGKVGEMVLSALKRGVREKKDIETLVNVELALYGLELSKESVVAIVPGIIGSRVQLHIQVRPHRKPATITSFEEARAKRRCGICCGIGCSRCEGHGWSPLRRAR